MSYQVILITGATAGIGQATALHFARQGYRLVLVARRQALLEQLQHQIGESQCAVIACDINQRDELAEKIQSLPESFRDIDVLVNNAGLALGLGKVPEVQWSDWQSMINTNCMAMAYLTQLLLPGMVHRNRGHIINIGSIAGTYPYAGGNVYGATKAFVKQFTLNLKADLLGTAVRVTNIEPGMVGDSEFSLVRFKGDQTKAEAVYQGIEFLKPEDIAASIAWAVAQPAHVNINRMEIMPVSQAPSRTAYHKQDQ